MVKSGLAILFLLSGLAVIAQPDPVLMRINGKEVFRSEFEYACRQNGKLADGVRKQRQDLLDWFVNFKLKVAEAEAAGLDTAEVFRSRLDSCRRQLVKSYLTDEETNERVARRFYDKMKSGRRAGQVRVSHIYKSLPQNISGYTLRKVEAKMDSIYESLGKGATAAAFDAYVKDFSDDKTTFWVRWLQMPAEFEEVAFDLQPGEISRPFFTPQGIHIVKVLERKAIPPFDEVKEEMIRCRTRRHGMDKGTEALVEKLKQEYHYTPDRAGMEELMSKGQTGRTLFTLGGRSYTGKEFARFAAAHPEGIQRQLNGFVMKSVLDYENNHLERKYPVFRLLMQKYREDMLFNEISNREVWGRSKTDEAGLKGYFEDHRQNYHWEAPRYKGIVLHCTSKRVSKQVRKFLKGLPENEWLDAIRLTFNAGDTPKVQAEQGLFARGDNAYVDDLVFKGKEPAPVMSFPFTAVLGKKVKGPEDYREVGGQLVTDYQNYLEQRWIAKLRAAGKVEINQEVLKTVNYH
mgnify:FL=1